MGPAVTPHLRTVQFVEAFDSEESAESADILSFETLRQAFSALRHSEEELTQTIPHIALSDLPDADVPEQAEYDIPEESDEPVCEACFSKPDIDFSPVRLGTVIEAMLFVSSQTLSGDQIAEQLRNVSSQDVSDAIVQLNLHYRDRDCPYEIIEQGKGYRMVLCSNFESVRSNFYGKVRGVKLSSAALEILSVVAYRQPITVEEIQLLRGSSSSILNQLVRRRLLCIRREVQDDKTTAYYHTTDRFLEVFQISSLDDLPRLEELG